MCKMCEDLLFERVVMMFGKSILSINRKACNSSVRGEFGILPAYHDIIIYILV